MKNKIVILLLLHFTIGSLQSQTSFTLSEAVEYGIQRSNTLRLKEIDVSDAAQQVNEYKSIGLPQINAKVDYSYYFKTPSQPLEDFLSPVVYNVLMEENLLPDGPIPSAGILDVSFVQKQNLSGSLEFKQLLFDPSYVTGLKAAKLYVDLVRKEIRISETALRAQITKAYLAVLVAQENHSILEKNIVNLEKSLNEIEQLYSNGFVELLDVDRMKVSLDNLVTQRDNISLLIEISKNLLKFQMNYPAEEQIVLTENLEALIQLSLLDQVDLSGDIDYDLRPEYDAILTGQELNQLDLKRLKHGAWPSLKGFASASETLQRNDLFDSNESGWLPSAVAGVSLNFSIWDGNQRRSSIQRTKLRIEKTELEKTEFERVMQLQVSNSRISLINAKRTLAQRKSALELNEDIYNKTVIKFNEGVGSSVEVTQAETSLYQAQSNYIDALYNLIISKTDLDIAQGKI